VPLALSSSMTEANSGSWWFEPLRCTCTLRKQASLTWSTGSRRDWQGRQDPGRAALPWDLGRTPGAADRQDGRRGARLPDECGQRGGSGVKRAARISEISVSPHFLRHLHGTHALRRGADLAHMLMRPTRERFACAFISSDVVTIVMRIHNVNGIDSTRRAPGSLGP